MATILASLNRQFKDLDLNFNIHPAKKDINKHVGDMAVINSIKNLILTNDYERPFHPEIGSNVRALLFENVDVVTANVLENEIAQVIRNYEPRASLKKVTVIPDLDRNAFRVQIEIFVLNQAQPVVVTFFLERVR